MQSPLADVTNIPTMDMTPLKDLISPQPPPPPSEEAVTTGATDTTLSIQAKLKEILCGEHKHSVAAFAAGNVAFAAFAMFDMNLFFIASYCVLVTVFANALAGIFYGPAPQRSVTTEMVAPAVQYIVDTVNAGLAGFTRVCTEPRLSFAAAASAYAVAIASPYLSLLSVAWLGFNAAFAIPQVQTHIDMPKIIEAARTAVAPMYAPNQAIIDGAKEKLATVDPNAVKVSSGLLVLLVYIFFLGWYHRLLVWGFGLLGCKAWSAGANEQVNETCKKIEKRARRMTMDVRRMTMDAFGRKSSGTAGKPKHL
jgi:hypothetical protein